MNHFITRLICLMLMVGLIGSYQARVVIANQSAEIKAMESALGDAQVMMEEIAAKKSESVKKEEPPEKEEASDSGFKDGTYQGEANGYGGVISVNVTIQDGAITAIEVLSAEKEDAAYFGMAKGVIDNIISAQSTSVDAISGATYSSTGIKNAVAAAVMKAAGE